MGDCSLEEITAPLPLLAIPPPSIFCKSCEDYRQKIFDWVGVRDDRASQQDFYEKMFTECGKPPVFPQQDKAKGAKDKRKGKGKGADHVDLSEDSDQMSFYDE